MATRNAIELDSRKLLGFKVLGAGVFNSAAKVGGSKKTDTEGQNATVKTVMGSMVGKVGKSSVTDLEDIRVGFALIGSKVSTTK